MNSCRSGLCLIASLVCIGVPLRPAMGMTEHFVTSARTPSLPTVMGQSLPVASPTTPVDPPSPQPLDRTPQPLLSEPTPLPTATPAPPVSQSNPWAWVYGLGGLVILTGSVTLWQIGRAVRRSSLSPRPIAPPPATPPRFHAGDGSTQSLADGESSSPPPASFVQSTESIDRLTPANLNSATGVGNTRPNGDREFAASTPPVESPPESAMSSPVLTETTRLAKINIVDELVQELRTSDAAHRQKVIWELSHRGDTRAIQPLVDLMVDSDSQQMSLILSALSEIGTRTLKPMSRALAISLQDESPEVRKNAIRDLTRIYEMVGQVSQLLHHAVDDPDAEVQETARWALGQLNRIRPVPGTDNLPALKKSVSPPESLP